MKSNFLKIQMYGMVLQKLHQSLSLKDAVLCRVSDPYYKPKTIWQTISGL